jgi:hypothetical protein
MTPLAPADNIRLAFIPFGKLAIFLIRIFKKKEPADFTNQGRYVREEYESRIKNHNQD